MHADSARMNNLILGLIDSGDRCGLLFGEIQEEQVHSTKHSHLFNPLAK